MSTSPGDHVDERALTPVRARLVRAGEKRTASRADPAGVSQALALREMKLALMGFDAAALAKAGRAVLDALEAVKDGVPDHATRLRAAEDVIDTALPKTHGNAMGGGKATVALEFPEWYRKLAESRTSRA